MWLEGALVVTTKVVPQELADERVQQCTVEKKIDVLGCHYQEQFHVKVKVVRPVRILEQIVVFPVPQIVEEFSVDSADLAEFLRWNTNGTEKFARFGRDPQCGEGIFHLKLIPQDRA